jgi:hypothetical protein
VLIQVLWWARHHILISVSVPRPGFHRHQTPDANVPVCFVDSAEEIDVFPRFWDHSTIGKCQISIIAASDWPAADEWKIVGRSRRPVVWSTWLAFAFLLYIVDDTLHTVIRLWIHPSSKSLDSLLCTYHTWQDFMNLINQGMRATLRILLPTNGRTFD